MANRPKFIGYPAGFYVQNSSDSLTATELSLEFCFLLFSLLIYIADILTDIILGVQYLTLGYLDWGLLTILLCVVPLLVCQSISLRWHHLDCSRITTSQALVHLTFLGVVQRYTHLLKLTLDLITKECNAETKQYSFMLYNHYQNDVSMLRLFESFLESAPQLLLQLYIMYEMNSWHPWTVFCATGSLVSLAWGVASYTRTMRNARKDKGAITWEGFVLQAVWRTGTIIARLFALLLCATVLHLWLVLALTAHWLFMTLWIVKQKTDFCATQWEEYVYNSITGVIYCFCFFNLKEGVSRQRMLTFYLIIGFENTLCLFLYFASHGNGINNRYDWFPTTASSLIIVGTIVGHASQLLYYRWFHPSGSIRITSCVSGLHRVASEEPQLSALENNCSNSFARSISLPLSISDARSLTSSADDERKWDHTARVCITNEISRHRRLSKLPPSHEACPEVSPKRQLIKSLSDSELVLYRPETPRSLTTRSLSTEVTHLSDQ